MMQKFLDCLKSRTVIFIALLVTCVLRLVSWVGNLVDNGFSFTVFLEFLLAVAIYALVALFTVKNNAISCSICLAFFFGTATRTVWDAFSVIGVVAGAGTNLNGTAVAFSVFYFLAFLFLLLSILALLFFLLAPIKVPFLPLAICTGICITAPLLLVAGILAFCAGISWYEGIRLLAECTFCVVLIPAVNTLFSGSAKTDSAASDASATESSAEDSAE